MRLLEAFIEVKLEGLTLVNAQIDALIRRLGTLQNVRLNVGGRGGGGGGFQQATSGVQRFFTILNRVQAIIGALSTIGRILGTILRTAFTTATISAQFFLAPLLSILATMRQIVAFGPRIALLFGVLAIKNLIDFEQRLERIRLLFGQAFGDEARNQFESLNAVAQELGVVFLDVAETFGRFAAATRTTLTLEDQEALFRGVTSAAVALGLETGKVQSIFVALEQIASKARISMEELRRQMANALPGAFGIAARSVNKTTDEFEKLIAAGDITPEELLAALGPQLIEEFGQSAIDASVLLNAQINRTINRFNELRAALSALVAAPVVRLLGQIAVGFERLGGIEFLTNFAQQFGGLVTVVGDQLTQLFAGVDATFQRIGNSLDTLARGWLTQIAAVIPIVVFVVDIFLRLWANAIKIVGDAMISIFNIRGASTLVESLAIVLAVVQNIDQVVTVLRNTFNVLFADIDIWFSRLRAFATAILNFFRGLAGLVVDLSEGLESSLSKRISDTLETLRQGLENINLQDAVDANVTALKEAFEAVGQQAEDSANNFGSTLEQAVQELGQTVQEAFRTQFLDITGLQRSLQPAGGDVQMQTLDATKRNTEQLEQLNRNVEGLRDDQRDRGDRAAANAPDLKGGILSAGQENALFRTNAAIRGAT